MGIGPIPRSKVREYARELGFVDDSDGFDRFLRLIAEMDNTYLTQINERTSSKAKNEPHQIAVDDVVGLKNMFANLARRQKNARPITKQQRRVRTNGSAERSSDTDD